MHEGKLLLCFDVGGTRIKAGVVALSSGEVLERSTASTPDGFPAALEALAELAARLTVGRAVEGLGIAVPGLIDERGAVVSLPGKLRGLEGQNLVEAAHARLGARAVVANDAAAYGTGEAASGAGRGATRAVIITLGTGVGVAVVEDGAPLGRGPLGGGILGGQLPIAEEGAGLLDSSGRDNTFEAFCAATRLLDYARQAGEGFAQIPDLFAAYRAGSAAARSALERYRGHLVRGLVALAHAHAPEVLVVGGGIAGAGSPLFEGLEPAVKRLCWPGYTVRVVPATLGDDAALVGLASLWTRRST